MEQLSLLPSAEPDKDINVPSKDTISRRTKRNWENAFQKWSDESSQDERNSCGCCGYGAMCDWCVDNAYGRPCVRALNAMLREKRQQIDYSKRDFESVWYGGGA